MPKRRRREWLQNGILLLVSLLVSYAGLEIGWRTYSYFKLREQVIAALGGVPVDETGQQSSIYDPQMGYSYPPNISVEAQKPFPIRYRTNRWGHVSDEEYPLEKPADEFRIVAVGDSFTANIVDTVRWSALLEERLNKNPEWLRFVHGKRTRIINLGRDGIGLVQMDKVLLLDGMRFTPDMVILDFIADDMNRKPFFRGNLPKMSATERRAYIEQRADEMLKTLPWFTPYPEALAAMTEGKLLPSKLTASFQLVNQGIRYSNRDEAIGVDVQAIQNILAVAPNTLILLHPQYPDFKGIVPGHLAGFLPELEKRLPGIHIEHMIKYFPPFKNEAELNSWFNYPSDLHMSDAGLRLYAKYVEGYLIAARAADTAAVHADFKH